MNKNHQDSGHDNQGTPIYIIMSVLFALVVFAVEGLKESLGRSGDSGLRMTTLAFVALGLTLCFFWRRMHEGPIKTVAAIIYTVGLWAYLFLILGAQVTLHGPSALAKMALFHQLGVGTVILSALVLMVALLNETKMVASLLLVGLAGLLTTVTSLFTLLQPSHKKGEHDVEMSAHPAGHGHGDQEEELAADSHGHGGGHDAPAHEEAADHVEHGGHSAAKAAHHEVADQHDEEEHEADADHNSHGVSKKSKSKESGSHKAKTAHEPAKPSKMKLSAKALEAEEEEEEVEPEEKPHTTKKTKAKKAADKHGAHWTYEDDHSGPAHWGSLSDDFALCESGTQQSPIDIPADWKSKNLVKVNYKESSFDVIDNGHTIQYNVAPGNFATIGAKTYQLKQIHFHTPSEHLMRGRSAILEAHFVHANDKGELAVLGTMIRAGKTHREYLKLWEYMPVKVSVNVKPKGVTFNPRSLLPDSGDAEKSYSVYNYPGSLTTPPCSEKVNWNVLVESVTMSQEQIQQFRRKYSKNARPVQDLGDR